MDAAVPIFQQSARGLLLAFFQEGLDRGGEVEG